MSKFLTELDLSLKHECDGVWIVDSSLVYESDLLKCTVNVPAGFETDLASVPRFPIVYWFWGGREHREAVLHDYLYRINSVPVATFREANAVFLEAAESRGKAWGVRYPMFWGVWLGGYFSYHKRKVEDKL